VLLEKVCGKIYIREVYKSEVVGRYRDETNDRNFTYFNQYNFSDCLYAEGRGK